ncbi:hypothetical protein Vadar_014981 [Vaccinium darrowii]|uniref:Uncharacterized protein n=1 Tax=Vaccinium darrowii TaxID=229202 RepID=A0ACB7XZC3_9ERIC|nr:hypothetical protein Vadar_014981 [Vaccinium darrowii]
MGTPHVLAIPYPAQGHVIPLLELAQRVAQHGFKVTFVNSEFNHRRVMNALLDKDNVGNHVNLVSIPDGLEPWEDRNDLLKLTESTLKIMSGKLEELIEKINGSDNNKITCVIADGGQGWALEVAEKMRIRRAAFWPAAATSLALGFSIPELNLYLLDFWIPLNETNLTILFFPFQSASHTTTIQGHATHPPSTTHGLACPGIRDKFISNPAFDSEMDDPATRWKLGGDGITYRRRRRESLRMRQRRQMNYSLVSKHWICGLGR